MRLQSFTTPLLFPRLQALPATVLTTHISSLRSRTQPISPTHNPTPNTAAANQLPGPNNPAAPSSTPTAPAPIATVVDAAHIPSPRVAAPQAAPLPAHKINPIGASSGKNPSVTSARMTTMTARRRSPGAGTLPMRRVSNSATSVTTHPSAAFSHGDPCPVWLSTLAGI